MSTPTLCPHCRAPRPSVPPKGGRCPSCGRDLGAAPAGAARGKWPAGRKALVGALALGVLAAAGYSIVVSVRALDRSAPRTPVVSAAPPAPPPAAAEDPSEQCKLLVFPGKPGVEAVVALTGPGPMTWFQRSPYGSRGRLAREVVRQSVLLAAREGLNLTARDRTIGDPLPPGEPSAEIEVDTLFPVLQPQPPSLLIARGAGDKRVTLLERPLMKEYNLADLRGLVEGAEGLAREAIPAALGKAGVPPGKAATGSGGPVPEGVEDRLRRMAFPEQLAAVRAVHEAIRTGGGSPERYGALARGYANLGLLTGFQWDAAAKGYQARGLLYAQRVVAADPKSPRGRWHRAYAEALAGSHRAALDDLGEAARLAAALPEADRPAPPGWVAMIDASCRYATDAIRDPGGRDGGLAATLRLMSVELPPNTDVALRAARAAIDAEPENFRAHDALCEVGGVANLHVATAYGPQVLSEVVPRRIAALPGVPAAARKAAEASPPDEVGMTRALDDAADPARDPGEPSWGALARVVRETRFVQVWRRLAFMRDAWNVPTDDYWQEVRPLVAAHRFRPFLEAYVVGPRNHPEFVKFLDGLDTADLGLNAVALSRMVTFEFKPETGKGYNFFPPMLFSADWVVGDLASLVRDNRKATSPDYARKLLSVSPNCPYAMGLLIEDSWDEAEKQLDGWRKVAGGHPTFLAALGRRYKAMGREEDAERALTEYVKLSPDRWAFEALAEGYKGRGDLKAWQATLDRFLETVEDHGLDHAQVRVTIADQLMKEGRLDDAQRYADAAARTWAGWAMACAQRCAEARKDWEAAEGWARARSERYPSSQWYEWLGFCQRSGHGDLAAARDWTLGYLSSFGDQAHGPALLAIACLHLMNREPSKAVDPLRRLVKESDKPIDHQPALSALIAAAALADDRALLDSSAGQFVDRYAKTSPKFVKVLAMVREAAARGGPGDLDRKAVDAAIEETPEPARGNPAFLVASYLAGRNRHAEAKPYWEQAARGEQTQPWWRLIATATLRDRP